MFLPIISLLDTIHIKQKIFFISQFENIFRWSHLNGSPCIKCINTKSVDMSGIVNITVLFIHILFYKFFYKI